MSPVEPFLEAMAKLASGVAIVTAKRPDGQPIGLLVTSLCSYSVDPPSVLIAIDRTGRSHDVLVEATQFGVQLLRSDQADVANVFASREADRFSEVKWTWNEEVPELDGTLGFLRCERAAVFEYSDHSILIGRVLEAHPHEGEPLVYFQRRFLGTLPGGSGSATRS